MIIKCNYQDCICESLYGFETDKCPRFCKDHFENGMITKITEMCKTENCKKRSLYGNIDTYDFIYCKQHSKDGMKDIITNKCNKASLKTIQEALKDYYNKIKYFNIKIPDNIKLPDIKKITEDNIPEYIIKLNQIASYIQKNEYIINI